MSPTGTGCRLQRRVMVFGGLAASDHFRSWAGGPLAFHGLCYACRENTGRVDRLWYCKRPGAICRCTYTNNRSRKCIFAPTELFTGRALRAAPRPADGVAAIPHPHVFGFPIFPAQKKTGRHSFDQIYLYACRASPNSTKYPPHGIKKSRVFLAHQGA